MATQTPTTSYIHAATNGGANLSTYFDSATAGNATLVITPRYSNSAGYVAEHTNTNNGGIGYWKIKTGSIATANGSVSGTTFTQGKVTINSGWIGSTSTVTGASFANTATSGVTYLDITDTNQAPIIPINQTDSTAGFLYINKGFTDNVKINLSKLIPDESITTAIAATHILQGYGAYNSQGTLLTGTIPTNSADNMTVSNNTISIAAGYYPESISKTVRSATLTYTGGGLNNKGATAGFSSNISTTSTNNGISLTAKGTAGRAAVTYASTTSGWVSVSSGGNVSAAVSSTTWDGTTYYISGITVPKDVPFTLTTVSDTALDDTSTVTITNGGYRKLNITNGGTTTVTNSLGDVTVSSSTSTGGTIRVNAYTNASGSVALSGNKTIISSGSWATTSIAATGSKQGPYYGEVYVKPISESTIVATVKSGNAVATISNPVFNNEGGTGGQFALTASGDVNAPTVSTAGYISSTVGTKQANTGGISGTKNLAVVTVGTTKTEGNLTVTPTLARTAKPSGDSWIDAASGASTTNTPTSGVYVQVDANAATNNLKIAGKVTTAGYGTTDHYNYSPDTYVVGAATAVHTYVPIKQGAIAASLNAAATSGSAGMTAQGFTALTGTNTSSYSVKLTTTAGSVVPKATVTTEGYVTTSTSATGNSVSVDVTGNNSVLYLPTATATGSVVNLTAPSVAISGSATGFTATSSGSYYVTITGTGTNGSVKGKATVGTTTGIVAASTSHTSAATTITPGITGSGTNIYIPKAVASATYTGGTVTCTNTSAVNASVSTTDTNNSGVTIEFKGTRAAATATVKIDTAGYAPQSATYAATNISAATSSAATYYIQNVTLTKPSSGERKFGITVPNGDSTITFVFHVGSSGDVVVNESYDNAFS